MGAESAASPDVSQDAASRGGPRTPEGKAVSCRNALKHGLAAKSLLTDILGRDLVHEHYKDLRREWSPTTPTQEFLVRNLAGHQAALERIEQIELAVLRRGARYNPSMLSDDDPVGDELIDSILAAAGTSDAIERISRYRRQHERDFLRSLATLREAKSMAASAAQPAFWSEEACQEYLVARLRDGDFRCPQCSSQRGKWITSRRVWQCQACRRQVGLRRDTVMEKSRISLLAWFCAIGLLVRKRDATTGELERATGIHRQGTLLKMARRIRQALNAPEASELLAGLDEVFRRDRRAC